MAPVLGIQKCYCGPCGGVSISKMSYVAVARRTSFRLPAVVKTYIFFRYHPPCQRNLASYQDKGPHLQQGVFLCTLWISYPWVWVPKPWNMALNNGIWDPKPRVTNIKGAHLMSVITPTPQEPKHTHRSQNPSKPATLHLN